MNSAAILLIVSNHTPKPVSWESPLDPHEVHAIADSGNEILWIYEGLSGKINRRICDDWANQVLKGRVTLEQHGIRGDWKQARKVSEQEFNAIRQRPYRPNGKFAVWVDIPPKFGPSLSGPVPPYTPIPEPSKALIGMIRLHQVIDVNQAADLLHLTANDVRVLLYTLVGDDKIKGEFEGDIFRITSGVEEFISALDQQFRKWETGEGQQQGKA